MHRSPTKAQATIAYSCHADCSRENIGDVLSGQGIATIAGFKRARYLKLPRDLGQRVPALLVYGGGGMVRPRFSQREVYHDFQRRSKTPYHIYGVGLNQDCQGKDFISHDFAALGQWLRRAVSVTVRDRSTQRFIREKTGLRARVAPCPSYSAIKLLKNPPADKLYSIGIVPSFGHTQTYKNFEPQIVALIHDIIGASQDKRCCLICHDQADYETAKKLFGGQADIYRPKNIREVQRIYARCQGVITCRAHGIIFSAAVGRPCSPVILSDKLSHLYAYHYGRKISKINFNASFHMQQLSKGRLPIDIRADHPFFNFS
ncbi:MAG: polysaccharide pyruvyl transferase family protein [Patescibacteria group bacterium]